MGFSLQCDQLTAVLACTKLTIASKFAWRTREMHRMPIMGELKLKKNGGDIINSFYHPHPSSLYSTYQVLSSHVTLRPRLKEPASLHGRTRTKTHFAQLVYMLLPRLDQNLG
jgi:hypothetical protein